MDLMVLFRVKIDGQVKTSVTLLPRSKKTQGELSGGEPTNFPVHIAAIEIHALKALQNRVGVPSVEVDVR